jgi:hypothetical protein
MSARRGRETSGSNVGIKAIDGHLPPSLTASPCDPFAVPLGTRVHEAIERIAAGGRARKFGYWIVIQMIHTEVRKGKKGERRGEAEEGDADGKADLKMRKER